MPETEEFSKGEDAKRAKLIEEALAKVEAELNNERKEKYCEDIVKEIQRLGGVLAENGFGSRPEDKHVVVSSHAGDETENFRGSFVQYETAVVARLIPKGARDDSGWGQAQETSIRKWSDCDITDPHNETQYNKGGYIISIVTGPAVEVYSDRPLTEEQKDYRRGLHQRGTVLVTLAGRCNDEPKILDVGKLEWLTDSVDPKAYELVLAAMQDIEEELPASKETQ